MESRRRLYVAGAVGASIAYVFVVLAFAGRFDPFEWFVFMAVFLAVFYGFERFVAWSERFE